MEIVHEFPDLQITLYLTSCYSGGWVVYPQLGGSDKTTTMLSVLAATEKGLKSESWPSSSMSGRLRGGYFTTSFVHELTAVTENSDKRTFREFTDGLTSIHQNVIDVRDLSWVQLPTFAAQDDDWEANWHRRTGITLDEFRRKYDALRDVSCEDPNPLLNPSDARDLDFHSPEYLAWKQRHPEVDDFSSAVSIARSGGSRNLLLRRVQYCSRIYLSSNPGPDNRAGNTGLHSRAKQCIRNATGYELPIEELQRLYKGLVYRAQIQELANMYKREMHLSFFEMEKFKLHEWESVHNSYASWAFADRLVTKANLFPPGNTRIGNKWDKPEIFLAAALTCSGLTEAEMEKCVRAALRCELTAAIQFNS
jgi:hypothetical protein